MKLVLDFAQPSFMYGRSFVKVFHRQKLTVYLICRYLFMLHCIYCYLCESVGFIVILTSGNGPYQKRVSNSATGWKQQAHVVLQRSRMGQYHVRKKLFSCELAELKFTTVKLEDAGDLFYGLIANQLPELGQKDDFVSLQVVRCLYYPFDSTTI